MKNLIKILLLVSVGMGFSQEKTYNFTEKQILGITKEITDLQVKDSLNTKIINDLNSIIKELEESAQIDSVIVVNKDKTIADLKEKSKLLEKKVKLVKPSWYENKWLYFTYGVVSVVVPVYLAGQLTN
jgi:hypothetical protein|tara:strand:+ start:322 stop:705 length:384 start_codon:yes stop_codon:yes gene_type:complete